MNERRGLSVDPAYLSGPVALENSTSLFFTDQGDIFPSGVVSRLPRRNRRSRLVSGQYGDIYQLDIGVLNMGK
jgi:hypothetical protein